MFFREFLFRLGFLVGRWLRLQMWFLGLQCRLVVFRRRNQSSHIHPLRQTLQLATMENNLASHNVFSHIFLSLYHGV
jgi:hypothetical protein